MKHKMMGLMLFFMATGGDARIGGVSSHLRRTAAVSSDPSKTAVAFAGGGYLAHSVYTGLITGLTKVASDVDNIASTLQATNVFDRFDIITSNSGGSWFLSQLAYSNSFLSLVQSAASDPNSAKAAYLEGWVKPFLATASDNSDFVKFLAGAIKQSNAGFGQVFEQAARLMNNGKFNWSGFVANLLRTTGQIDKSARLGDNVNEWAKDKIWIVAASLLTPGGKCSHCDTEARFWDVFGGEANYKLSDSQRDQPLFTPVRYNIRMGSGAGASGPLPFCAPTMCDSLSLEYTGTQLSWWGGFSQWKSTSTLDTSDTQTHAGALSLTEVVAASSSFAGFLPISELNHLASGREFSVWSSMSGGDSFSAAQQAVAGLDRDRAITQTSVKQLSSMGYHGVMDGGANDNSAIAHAVGAGADEVVAFGVFEQSLFALFQRSPETTFVALGGFFENNHIFAESVSDIKTRVAKFDKLNKVGAASTYLRSIEYGTLTVTTADVPAFGITAGRTITLHVVLVASELFIGGTHDFAHYATLVQEIVSSILAPENLDARADLLKFMKGN